MFFLALQDTNLIVVIIGGSAIAHIVSSFIRFNRRIQRESSTETEQKSSDKPFTFQDLLDKITPLTLHRVSGYVLYELFGTYKYRYTLSALLFLHASATRLPDLLYESSADFSVVSFSLYKWPIVFYPYYAVLALSGFYHLTYGSIQAVKTLGLKVTIRCNILTYQDTYDIYEKQYF
jgi:hypothetical protein